MAPIVKDLMNANRKSKGKDMADLVYVPFASIYLLNAVDLLTMHIRVNQAAVYKVHTICFSILLRCTCAALKPS